MTAFALAFGLAALGGASRDARIAVACTPGPQVGLGTAVSADAIVIARVVRAGSSVNSLPVLTPQPVPTAMIGSPPFAEPPPLAEPYTFDLTGYGATLEIERTISGAAPPAVEVGAAARAFMEQEVRQREAYRGSPTIFSDCPLEWSAHTWVAGARYLVFLSFSDEGATSFARYRLEGDDVVLTHHPDTDPRWPMEAVQMTTAMYARFFTNVEGEVAGGSAVITADRVPMSAMLGAIADMRGEPSILPPEAGNAGPKAR
jgi:hypothetical protein